MFKGMTVVGTVLGLAILAGAASGQDAAQKALADATKARQAQMQLYAFNLGLLGGMAKGEVPYDATAASAAAGNLASLAQLDQSRLWPEGSDEMGVEGSKVMAELWQNMPDVMSKGADLVTAATAMEVAAGTDLASLQAAMGPLGGACGACHKAYRVPSN
ncbi:MAG: cytochrome c [Paracoccaceae bacterium]|jgi:cytochrome c556|uniref:c-type cytochrome n=1 Tax=unclassified Seohaeicola TaxID=2641111 RepID=UPI00237B1253|nr:MULTISPECIES: cytochrome c [unclassified Seohaeicola]MDD9707288.1 cytochrome c [Seohaeicola sp. 4SK31]MDD9735529.1 cytochrome c [Seohaeicola sp. SP36]MDF1710284.1 cytochrome c [Paracoccaceae bacterium]MDM7970679.1 cytochrome c [Paracoccaceae bacterium]